AMQDARHERDLRRVSFDMEHALSGEQAAAQDPVKSSYESGSSAHLVSQSHPEARQLNVGAEHLIVDPGALSQFAGGAHDLFDVRCGAYRELAASNRAS